MAYSQNTKIDEASLKSALVDIIYPVNSIYMSVVNTSPASFLGGTWTQLKDRFLLGAGDTYSNGSTGGEANHTLTTTEMPSHYHSYTKATGVGNTTLTIDQIPSHSHPMGFKYGWYGGGSGIANYNDNSNAGNLSTQSVGGGKAHNHSLSTESANTGSTGSGNSHNNMPPYLVVYMWKRTA